MPAFKPGNIVVYRVGTGGANSTSLTNGATQVYIDEYTPAGDLVQSIALPGTGTGTKLTSQGTSTTEGMINLTVDGKYLLLPGYNAELNSMQPASATAANAPRVIGRIGADGVVDLSTILSDLSVANRSVASLNGSIIYDATSTGVRLANYGVSASSTAISSATERTIGIFNNQLFVSTAAAISAVGTGLPTAATTQTPIVFTTGNAVTLSSIYGFFFADLTASVGGVDTLYVADDNIGLVKYSLTASGWSYNGTIGTTLDDYRGLTASVSGTTVTLFAARDNGTGADTLVQVVDTGGYNATFSNTTTMLVATATLNTGFRGVALVPQNAVPATETIAFSSTALTQAEGDTGTTAFAITLTRSGSTAAAASVAFAVSAAAGSTGLDAADFGGALPGGIATFAAGSATATITINVAGDRVIEATEQFVVTLSGPSAGYVVADGGATQIETITNDDVAGTVSIADLRVDEGAGTATITLTRSGGSADVTVNYATADGTAIAGQDYTATSGTASFTGGATSATVTVAILNDGVFEGDEAFTVGIAAGTGAPTIGRAAATVTIADNDQAFAPGTFAITPATASVAEGGSGSTPISFGVTRTDGSFGVVVVPYTITFTGPNAANAGDFATGQTFSGTVTFADGQTTAQTITLQVQGDNAIEANETFTVTLGTPSAGTLATASAVGTIVNDDSAFAIAAGSASEATAGVPFVVTRTGDLSQAATLAYAVSLATGDTATTADFTGGTLPSGTVSFAAGAATATVLVPVLNDTLIEANETFTVTLSGANANQTITTATATGTILNDDQPLLTINDPSVVEGNAGTTMLRYTVTSNVVAPAGGISFDIATADGTATAGSDYVARGVTGATIAAGQTSYTFDIVVNGDTAIERAETVSVNLSNPTGAAIADAQGIGFIDNDDGAPVGLQPYFSTNFSGFTAAGFTPNPTAAQLDSDVWRVAGLSDLPNPVYGGTYLLTPTTGDFARGPINAGVDPTSGGVYSPVSNNALVVQPTGTDFENGGFIEAQLVNTTGFTATSFEVAFDWAYRNSGDRGDALAFSYSTDGVTFLDVPAAAFTTPAAKDAALANVFSIQSETLSLSNLFVGDGNALFLRWTHTGSTGGGNRDEVGIDNVVVRAGLSDVQTLSASDVVITEGTGGTTNAVFTITRTSAEGTASVDFATSDGTALAGRDYTALSGTVSFAAGERSKTVSVAINPDAINEANETFYLNLKNATGVTLTDAQAAATIVNDDTGPVAIYDIQGAGHVSPFRGNIVTTVGIVTAINANSYWIQEATGDGIFGTSDAIQVVFGTGNASGVLVGDRVQVRGTVTEFVPATGALGVTELTAPTVMLLERGVALPTAILIGVDGILPPTQVIDNDRLTLFDPTQDGIDFYEALEGMLVTVQAPLVVSNSDGRATFIVASGGVGATGINDRGGITLSAGDDAPERIQLFADSTLLPGYTPSHTVGDILGNITGILTYFTYPELLPTTPVVTTTDVTLQPEISALSGDANHLLVASFNIENADPTDPQAKFDAIGAEVVNNLKRPDIIGLQEVQDADGAGAGTNLSGQATADKIIAAIKAAGGPTYVYIEIAPTTANSTGGEPGGNIRNGYLYNPDRVSYVADSAALAPGAAFVGTRSPLAATFAFAGQNVTLIDAHSTSRGGSDLSFGATQPPAQAGDAARTAQATAIKAYIDGLQAANPGVKVVTVGDFNGYYYETALSQLTNDGKQTNLYTLLPVEERYSYLFDGAVQAFDNIIVTNNLLRDTRFDVVHINAQAVNQPITDHDQALASIYFNTAPTDLTISSATLAENAPAGTLVGTVAGVDTAVDTLRYSLIDDAGGRFAIDATTGRVTTTAPFDFEAVQSASITVRVTDNDGLFYDEAFRIAVTDVNEAPTALTVNTATVAENAPAGTLVGTVAGVDPERGTLRYSLVDSAGGLFAVDPVTGRITTTAPIDFETRSSATIVARVTDAGGLTFDRTLAIAVTNVNEAPSRPVLTGATVAENATAGTVIGTLAATDPDAGDTVTFSLATPDARFRIVGNQLVVASGAVIDYETQQSIALSVAATDLAGLSTTAAVTLTVTDVAETLPGGTSGNDTLTGGIGADIINAGDGNDIVNGGLGRDTITLGAGMDTVRGLLADIVGDTITDFTFDDRLIVQRSDIARGNLTVSGTGAGTVVTFPGGGTLALPAGLTGGDLMAAHAGTDSIITFNPYLAALSEGGMVATGAINGITNQAYLTGDTANSFTVSVESLSGARFANSLGVYEIDSVTGAISDVRIIAANVKTAGGALTVSGVDAGHQLGFFIVQDGANKLSNTVLQSNTLSLVAENGHLVLANNGAVVGGATTFFSHSAAASIDGQAHVLSGVSADGQGAIRIGFEDLARGGSASDNDFQDVVITVAAVPMVHATSTIGGSDILFASGDAVADALHYMPAHEAMVVHDFVIA